MNEQNIENEGQFPNEYQAERSANQAHQPDINAIKQILTQSLSKI
tara:strand:- start:34 stop:168 length:135 start_codon:yes stop_codon:yes gene_type:complete